MTRGIGVAIQQGDALCSEPFCELEQCASSSEAQDEIELAEALWRNVADRLACAQSRERHGCVEVVEHGEPRAVLEQHRRRAYGVGTIRGDDAGVRGAQLPMRA